MILYWLYDGEISSKFEEQFIEKINEVQALKFQNPEYEKYENIKLKIIFSSDGGFTDSMQSVIEMINENKDIVILKASSTICSCAFTLFFSVQCEREISEVTVGMTHTTVVSLAKSITGYDGHSVLANEESKRSNNNQLELLNSLGVNPKKIKMFKQGKDVWFSSKELKTMLEIQNNNKDNKDNRDNRDNGNTK